MKTKQDIKEIILDFRERMKRKIIPREMQLPANTNKIITVSGVRRSGKTFLLLHQIQELLAQKVPFASIIYMNFEDERLNLKTNELDLILQAQRELVPEIDLSKCWFFFDEIQNVSSWEKFVRRINDSYSSNIFLTGSNSKLLSSEISTSLRGRTLNYEVYPLSFKEFLKFKNIEANLNSAKNKSLVNNAYQEYLFRGGFPEIVHYDKTLADKTLQSYYHVMLYKDLIERYNIQNISVMNYFISRLISNITNPTSINKIYNEIKSNGYQTSKNVLYDIMDWLEAIYFGFRVHKFDYSSIDRNRNEKKFYLTDNGLINALTFEFSKNYGKLTENLAAVVLKRKFEQLYFYKEKSECDFVVFEKDKPLHTFQVAYNISHPDTLKREIKGLTESCKYFGLNEGTIITSDFREPLEVNSIKINFTTLMDIELGDFY